MILNFKRFWEDVSNDAVANHIWDSLVHTERVNVLEEAGRE